MIKQDIRDGETHIKTIEDTVRGRFISWKSRFHFFIDDTLIRYDITKETRSLQFTIYRVTGEQFHKLGYVNEARTWDVEQIGAIDCDDEHIDIDIVCDRCKLSTGGMCNDNYVKFLSILLSRFGITMINNRFCVIEKVDDTFVVQYIKHKALTPFTMRNSAKTIGRIVKSDLEKVLDGFALMEIDFTERDLYINTYTNEFFNGSNYTFLPYMEIYGSFRQECFKFEIRRRR